MPYQTGVYTVGDHLAEALFGNRYLYRCEDCGLTTGWRVQPFHWLVWFAHDMTIGWGPKHWAGYDWGSR